MPQPRQRLAERIDSPVGEDLSKLDAQLEEKYQSLRSVLSQLGSVLVAFSGGVDSSFLLKVASEVLGKDVLAVTAVSDIYPDFEHQEAVALARDIGVRHRCVDTSEIDRPEFLTNPPDRCYYCKQELFGMLWDIAKEEGLAQVVDGANADDGSGIDYRPGLQAGSDLGVRSPLREVGLTKEDIRQLSRSFGLPTWNKPSFACLASRFPYGTPITPERLKKVGQAEDYLRQLGFRQLRVRYHDDIARIEVPSENQLQLLEHAREIVTALKEIGFTYVTVDLQGYRTGSMNEALNS